MIEPQELRRARYLHESGKPPETDGLTAVQLRERLDLAKALQWPRFTLDERVEIVTHLLKLSRLGKIGTVFVDDWIIHIGDKRGHKYRWTWPKALERIARYPKICRISDSLKAKVR